LTAGDDEQTGLTGCAIKYAAQRVNGGLVGDLNCQHHRHTEQYPHCGQEGAKLTTGDIPQGNEPQSSHRFISV